MVQTARQRAAKDIRASAALVAALILVLAGLGSGCSGPAEPTSTGAASAEVTAKKDPGDGYGTGALAAYWELVTPAEDAYRQAFDEWREYLSQCMKDEGFVYVPTTWEDQQLLGPRGGIVQPAPTREEVAEYGYSVSLPMPPSVGLESDVRNSAIVADLSDTEREAWTRALGYDGLEPPGCTQTAPVPETAGMSDGEAAKWLKARDELKNLHTEIEVAASYAALEDPRVTQAEAAFPDCMADHGYPGPTVPRAALEAFAKEYQAKTGGGAVAPDATWLREFQAREKDTALVDFDCAAPIEAARDLATQEAEQRLIADALPRLEAWQATYFG